jgi:signal transduction histidine kinase
VLVAVADSGSGIEAEDLKRVFEPFFTTKAPGAGTGLGLSVSFGIIQDHHGAISALSPSLPTFQGAAGPGRRPPGPGSVFLVELPVSPDEPGADSCEDLVADARLSSYQQVS